MLLISKLRFIYREILLKFRHRHKVYYYYYCHTVVMMISRWGHGGSWPDGSSILVSKCPSYITFLPGFTQCELVASCEWVCLLRRRTDRLAVRGFCKIQFIVSAVTGPDSCLGQYSGLGDQDRSLGQQMALWPAAKCSNSQIKSRNKLTIVNKTNWMHAAEPTECSREGLNFRKLQSE